MQDLCLMPSTAAPSVCRRVDRRAITIGAGDVVVLPASTRQVDVHLEDFNG